MSSLTSVRSVLASLRAGGRPGERDALGGGSSETEAPTIQVYEFLGWGEGWAFALLALPFYVLLFWLLPGLIVWAADRVPGVPAARDAPASKTPSACHPGQRAQRAEPGSGDDAEGARHRNGAGSRRSLRSAGMTKTGMERDAP